MMTPEYLLYQGLRFFSVLLVGYVAGLLAIYGGVRVNYTRKIFHFAIFFLPILFAPEFDVDGNPLTLSISTGVILLLGLGMFMRPVRERLPLINTIYRGVDRPEDRPYTLFWLTTQIITGYIVLLLMVFLLQRNSVAELVMIPVLINGIGDGLAEPVGVRFGRYRYNVRAFLSKRRYQRSLEGSSCVFLTSIAVMVLFADHFTMSQFWTGIVAIPVLMTLAEAFSPHTWDSPFLFLVGGLTLLGIIQWV